jgi:hypothetical protein
MDGSGSSDFEIACPAVNTCVGIGAADQGSYHTPVYTNAGG